MSITYWPHQEKAHKESRELFGAGMQSWCLVAPCGAGKSLMMQRHAIPAAARGLTTFIYTHRIMLTRQTIEAFETYWR